MEKKSISELSIDSQELVRLLLTAKGKPGHVFGYEELSKLIGRDVRYSARGYLTTARRILQRDHRMVFGTIRKTGLKLLDAVGVNESVQGTTERVRRVCRKGIKTAACVEYGELKKEDQTRYNASVSILGALYEVTKVSSVKRMETIVEKANDKLTLSKTLEAFKG